MPDVTLIVQDISGAEEAEKLERALSRLGSVQLVNVDSENGLVAISYEGEGAEMEEIGESIRDAGYDFELSPGARRAGE